MSSPPRNLPQQTTHTAQSDLALPSGEPQSAVLEILHCPDPARVGARWSVDLTTTLSIGRDAGSEAGTVADPRMSRVHVRVAYDPTQYAFRASDARSRNGTTINRERIESEILNSGDILRAGDTLFLFCEEDPMLELAQEIERVAGTLFPVLILGETGTGKELVARRLHQQSERRGDFVAVNCAALPKDLAQAELFGHAKGAFSGAAKDRKGLFRAADHGTLFLDEIGDLPLDLQPILLRAIQERRVRPVGAEREIEVDVRFLAATHADLRERVNAGTFRADLYARLAHTLLLVPPVRERRGEILKLLLQFAEERGLHWQFSADAAEALCCGMWPLNVRELQALVAALAGRAGEMVDARLLRDVKPELFQPAPSAADCGPTSPPKRVDADALRELLARHSGNVAAIAKELGKPRAQIYRWMKAYGVDASQFRD